MKRLIVILTLLAAFAGREAQCLEITKKLLIINNLAESLSAVDLRTGTITHTESNVYGLAPNAITVHNGRGYVVNSLSHDISVIDLEDYSVLETISLPGGSNPWSMVFTGLNEAYVTSYMYNRVYVLDVSRGAVTDSITVGMAPGEMLRVDTHVYVLNSGFDFSDYSYSQGTVSVINTRSREEAARLSVPLNPQSITLAPNGKIYVLSTGDYFAHFGKIAVIENAGGAPVVVDSVVTGGSPGDIKFTSAGKGFIAAGGEWGSGTKGYVYLYDSEIDSVLHGADNPIIVGNGAGRILIDNATDDVFVSCFQDDNVQKLNPANGAVIAAYEAGDGAQAMALHYLVRSDTIGVSTVRLEINSGSIGDSVSLESFGNAVPSELSSRQNFTNAVEYFHIDAEVNNFSAVLTVSYSDSLLDVLGVSEDNLILSYFSDADSRWHAVPTVINAAGNTASAEVTHFSYWALADKTDDLIAAIGDARSVPNGYSLAQNYPNPFNPATTISFTLPKDDRVVLTAYNILGQRVKRLVSGALPAGEHRVVWDGTSDAGKTVAAGVYFYRIEAGAFSAVKKMLYLR